ncbi:MAG: Mrp/NBP35 family ATP-binding protein [candidate division Zixibacteria bacterium]|nr:Mrp/NBP35 family ATP-binding protein [candidate division Zixibacteria bacterium]MDD5427130.1 Mrp/NBP35 family ATP-binding protein [candidate division Zixibacteria bacterium]
MIDKQTIMQVLSKIKDPELKRSFTELDMVKFVDIEGNNIRVGISLTGGCPFKEKIAEEITKKVGELEGVGAVKVEFDEMSKEQLVKLKEKLGVGQPRPDDAAAIAKIAKRFIAVSSGKGGVGKSTITANLASALARLGFQVGVLDADVYGFSIPRMLGVDGVPKAFDDKIIPLRKGDNLQIISMGFFISEDEPVIWRGPLLHKAISQFITDVMWENLDFLLLDLPPGTGDVTITIAQAIPSAELLVVTTPQATATNVASRVAKMADKTKLNVIGVIENMAYYDNNGRKDYIFGKDGGKNLAAKLNVAFLGEIPLITSIREGADAGKPVASEGTEQEIKLFEGIAQAIVAMNRR